MKIETLNAQEITRNLLREIEGIKPDFSVESEGEIVSVKDGVLEVYGLKDVGAQELILLGDGRYALAMNLDKHSVGAVVLGSSEGICEGDKVKRTGKLMQVSVGEALLGRVVNALGQPMDGLGPVKTTQSDIVEKIAPGVITRQAVSEPLQTGITCIDAMVPIGRGQRELIIGDRKTGKTSVALDSVINQRGTGVKCIYVAIGCKASTLSMIVELLKQHQAFDYTTVVSATAAESAALQYLAPYSGCTMGEYFRDKGEDALIIYDDLSKHAVAYRQLSLLLRRPPGREAFPGDVFYLHSRLLERASCVSADYVESVTKGKVKGKNGSLTALPIIETQAGDLSAFVPTNVISITDGQIYLETDLFNSGVRPALNTGLSVSRVGGAAQTSIIKKLSGGLRVALAQYKEIEAFSQFSQDLDEETKAQLARGKMMMELLKQPVTSPLTVAEMAVILLSPQYGLADIVLDQVGRALELLLKHFREEHTALLEKVMIEPKYTKDLEGNMGKIIQDFLIGYQKDYTSLGSHG